MEVEFTKPWRYSKDGKTVIDADIGDKDDLSDSLAKDAFDLEVAVPAKEVRKVDEAPENKTETAPENKGKARKVSGRGRSR